MDEGLVIPARLVEDVGDVVLDGGLEVPVADPPAGRDRFLPPGRRPVDVS